MGYRDNWLSHAGAVSVHEESTLHAFDRSIPVRPLSLLLAGVGNGGAVEVWRDTLPEGSTITAVDADPRAVDLPGLGVRLADVTDRGAVGGVLRGLWFDFVIDSTGTMAPNLWPFLRAGGGYLWERYKADMIVGLVQDLAAGRDSWLPIEEVMRIDVYPGCAVVEKRNPRVVPYLQIMTGNFADLTGEQVYLEAGVKRVIPA